MAVAITKPSSQIGDTSALSVFSMAPTFLPPAYAKIVVFAHASGTVTGSISGTGSTFSLIASQNTQALGGSVRMWEMDAPAAATSVSINVDYTGDAATGATAAAVQITGQAAGWGARQVVNVNSVGPNPVITFTDSVISGNAVIVGIPAPGALCIFTPPAGFTSILSSYGTPATGLGLFYASAVAGTTFTFSTGAQADLGYIAAEYHFQNDTFDSQGMMGFFGV